MGARNRVVLPARQAPQPGGIGSLESIHGLLKSLKIRAQITPLPNPAIFPKFIKGIVPRVENLVESPKNQITTFCMYEPWWFSQYLGSFLR